MKKNEIEEKSNGRVQARVLADEVVAEVTGAGATPTITGPAYQQDRAGRGLALAGRDITNVGGDGD